MSPSEITSSKSTAEILQKLTTASYLPKKSSNRATVSKERRSQDSTRSSSPFSPWGEETILSPPRKSSLKGSSRQSKGLKNLSKDTKAKDKKENGKASGISLRSKQSSEDNEKKTLSNFRHHPDISEYIKEYRDARSIIIAGHRSCSCHGIYGPEEIEKAYDSLGLPKLMHRARVLASSKKTVLPTVSDQEEQEYADAEISDSETVSQEVDDEEGEEEGLSSPDARERRNNLNLTPIRKHVRLPDMKRYPVQSISGFGVHELARLATARNESRQNKNKSSNSTPTLRYSMTTKPIFSTPLHLQEKNLCRVVELSIPETSVVEDNQSEKSVKNLTNRTKNTKEDTSKQVLKSTNKTNFDAISRLKISEYNGIQDDNFTVTIGTNRSNQSSVLSNAVSSISPNSTSCGHNQNRTVREMLTAAVRDLHPFSETKTKEEPEKEEDLSKKESSVEPITNIKNSKQLVSLRNYRNLSYKPSMRKFMEELYTPTAENLISENKHSCLVAGKQLRRIDSLSEPFPPVINNKNSFSNHLKADISMNVKENSTRNLLKQTQRRQQGLDVCGSIRHVVTLKSTRQNPTRLAIFSKCHTVVKPQVSVRGVAL